MASLQQSQTMSAVEKRMLECAEKRIDCIRCPHQWECQKAWDKFIDKGTNGRDITSPEHWARFERCLTKYQL